MFLKPTFPSLELADYLARRGVRFCRARVWCLICVLSNAVMAK